MTLLTPEARSALVADAATAKERLLRIGGERPLVNLIDALCLALVADGEALADHPLTPTGSVALANALRIVDVADAKINDANERAEAAEARIVALSEALRPLIDSIERCAFEIPPLNKWTPDLVMGCVSLRQQIHAALAAAGTPVRDEGRDAPGTASTREQRPDSPPDVSIALGKECPGTRNSERGVRDKTDEWDWKQEEKQKVTGTPTKEPTMNDTTKAPILWEHAMREVATGNREFVLRDMAKQGWELISTADNGFTLFFKRQKREIK